MNLFLEDIMSKLKRLCCIMMCITLLFTLCHTAETEVSAAGVTYGYVNGVKVNVRKGAGTSYESVGTLTHVNVIVLGSAQDSKGTTWYNIKTVDGSLQGYMHSDYIDLDKHVNILKGDVNGDFCINSADLAALNAHLSGAAPLSGDALKAADTNNDGYIDGTDLTNIQNHINGTISLDILAFPESYHAALISLKGIYPYYTFVADYVDIPFYEAVENETKNHRKLVSMNDGISWRSCGQNNYDWSTGTWTKTSGNWTDASAELIAYYMDPRNFLNANNIYTFVTHSYSSGQTAAGVEKIIKGTFLEKGYSDANDTAYGGSYVNVIMEAARQSGVSPYVLASTIILEQGVNGTSGLISGPDYYNFFNYGASGSDVIGNGLEYAKNAGWTTRSASIIGGAIQYASGYIAAGQNTYYYKDFDVADSNPYTHQYAQSVYDAVSSSARLRNAYRDMRDLDLVFRIPVYNDMPEVAPSKPAENSTLNNYYFTDITASGLSPTFSMYTKTYSLTVSGDTSISVSVPSTASYVGQSSYSLSAGQSTLYLPVRSQSGYNNYYTITVYAAAACTVSIICDGNAAPDPNPTTPSQPAVTIGDINSDGVINTADLAAVKLHLLGIRTLSGTEITAADINSDGTINTADLAGVKLHLLGLRSLN